MLFLKLRKHASYASHLLLICHARALLLLRLLLRAINSPLLAHSHRHMRRNTRSLRRSAGSLCWPTQPRWAGAAASAVCGWRPPGNTLVAPSLLCCCPALCTTAVPALASMLACGHDGGLPSFATLPLLQNATLGITQANLLQAEAIGARYASNWSAKHTTPAVRPHCWSALAEQPRCMGPALPLGTRCTCVCIEHSLCCPARLLLTLRWRR